MPGVISKLPVGSRLFVGHLAAEKTDKFEIASIFVVYGSIVEILLKGSFGFVQYMDPVACNEAILCENGRVVGGVKIDLSVSRDKRSRGGEREEEQPPTRRGDGGGRDNRHERERDRRRGNVDSYHPVPGDRRDRERDRERNDRREREFDRREKERDRFERDRGRRGGRSRSRSRSRSPPGGARRGGRSDTSTVVGSRAGGGAVPGGLMGVGSFGHQAVLPVGRFQPINLSMSNPNEFALPRRYPPNVPDCQVIVLDDVDRTFISHVESVMRNSGIPVETLFLSRKMSLKVVVHQMIMEGVKAIIFVEHQHVRMGTVSMHVFSNAGTVAEYDNITIEIAAAVFHRDHQSSIQSFSGIQTQGLGLGPLQSPQQMMAALGGVGGHQANLLTSLLGGTGQQQSQQQSLMQPQVGMHYAGAQNSMYGGGAGVAPLPTANSTTASLLAQLQQQQQQPIQSIQSQQFSGLQPSSGIPMPSLKLQSALSGLIPSTGSQSQLQSQQPQQQPPSSVPNLSGFLSILGKQQQQQQGQGQIQQQQPASGMTGVGGGSGGGSGGNDATMSILAKLRQLQELGGGGH
ncbi:hypothetical protein HDU76_005229 [Blyttiomyces sp. JEL0837]|nr:hypothetical protein HDU76_005229 [Blyttiomyces sp. JEL0837]